MGLKGLLLILCILLIPLVSAIDWGDELRLYLPFNSSTDDYSENSITTMHNSSVYLYQETANNTIFDGDWLSGREAIYTNDSDWTTFGMKDTGSSATVYWNYTKPSLASSGSLWQIMTGNNAESSNVTNNFTIPTLCWNQDLIELRARSYDPPGGNTAAVSVDCWNSTTWHLISNITGASGATAAARIYEEAMYWNLVNYTSDKNNLDNNAIYFDGDNANIDLGINNDNFFSNNITSMSAWIYINETTGGSIISSYEGVLNGDDAYSLVYTNNYIIRVSGSGHYLCDPDCTTTVDANTWTHIAVVLNGTYLWLYEDGVLSSNGNYTLNSTRWNTSANVRIGARGTVLTEGTTMNGSLDEVRIYNRSLASWEVENLYNTYSNFTLNISSNIETRDNQSTGNFTVYNNLTDFGVNSNCTILSPYLSCTNNSANVTCSYSQDINTTFDLQLVCYDSANGNAPILYGANISYLIDNVLPTISKNFTTGTTFFRQNITGQFNFSDSYALYRWNVSIDGTNIDGAVNVAYNDYIFNFSYDPSNLQTGTHTLSVQVADGHTASVLKEEYEVNDGILFKNDLEFTTSSTSIKIEPKDKSLFDVFSYEKKKDRYSFSFEPNKKEDIYTFIVTTEKPLHLIERPNTIYKQWLISGDNWIDFHHTGETSIRLLDNYSAEITVNSNKEVIKFNSVGDLNIVTENFTFYTINASISYENPTYEGKTNVFNLSVNITNTTYVYNDINATFEYNGTAYTATKTSSIYFVNFTTSMTAPTVDVNTDYNFTWNITVTNESIYQYNATQSVYAINIGNCSNASWTKALTFHARDEETLENVSNMSLNINVEVIFDDLEVEDYGFEFIGLTNYSICLYPNSSNLTINARMEYISSNYSDRKYYLNDLSINNITQDVYLFHLLDTQFSDIELTVYDKKTGQTVENAYVKILRYYPGLDNGTTSAAYRTVEIEKTDINGETLAKMVLADVWYKFIVEIPAGTVKLDSDLTKILTTDKTLPISIAADNLLNYNELVGISYDVTCKKSTNTCRFTWSDDSNIATKGELRVYRDMGYSRKLIYSEQIESAAATIAYVISENTTGNKYSAEGWVYYE